MKSSKEEWYPFNKYLIGEPERARLPIFKYYIKEPKDRLDPHIQSIKFAENFKCFHHFSSNEKVTHCYMLFHCRFQMFCKPLGSFINICHLIVFSSCYWSTPSSSFWCSTFIFFAQSSDFGIQCLFCNYFNNFYVLLLKLKQKISSNFELVSTCFIVPCMNRIHYSVAS